MSSCMYGHKIHAPQKAVCNIKKYIYDVIHYHYTKEYGTPKHDLVIVIRLGGLHLVFRVILLYDFILIEPDS